MRDEYSRGEFEARNRQLPADLNQTTAFASNAQARADFDATPVGTPPTCYDVRSVFDVRPVNTYDFYITQSGDFTSGVDALLEMTVPEGYTAVLRSVEFWGDANLTAFTRQSVTMDVLLNGGNYPNNAGIPVGNATDGPMPFYLLADEFNRIGIRINYGSSIGSIFAIFHGNFILKTNRAYPFEIANPSFAPGCATQPRIPTVEPAAQRVVTEPVPATPVLTAPSHTEPTRNVPPFQVRWRKAFDTKGIGAQIKAYTMLIPMEYQPPKKTFFGMSEAKTRDLTRAEIQQYFDFLDAHPMKSQERELWNNFVRAIGVK